MCKYYKSLIKEKDADAQLYLIGLIIGVIAGIVAIIWLTTDNPFKICMFRAYFGMYCPGCGGTRAFFYFFHGNIIKSIEYNPFVPYAIIVAACFYISQTLRFATRGRIRGISFKAWFIYAGIAMLIISFVTKNYIYNID